VHAAFSATGLPYAEATWRRVGAVLDRYRSAWVDTRVAACRASRARGDSSEAQIAQQVECLGRRRSLVRELTQVWLSGTDASSLAAAGDAVARLPAISACADGETVENRAPPARDAAAVAKIAGIREGLDRVRALDLAGRSADARERLPMLIGDADATGWAPLSAEARYLDGHLRAVLHGPAAEPRLLEASRLAVAAHDDRLAATALVELVRHLASNPQSTDQALLIAEIADSVIARVGDNGSLRASLLRSRGDVLLSTGELAEARDQYVRARELAIEVLGPDSTEALLGLTKLASVADSAGDVAEASRLSEQAVAETSALFGAEHPRVGEILMELGAEAYSVSHYDVAADYYRRALAIAETAFGPSSVDVAAILDNLGASESMRGDLNEAKRMFERAVTIRGRMAGAQPPVAAEVQQRRARVRRPQGEIKLPELGHALVERVAWDHGQELSRCDGNEELHGEVAMKFMVDVNGKVSQVQVLTEIKKPKVVACLLRTMHGWQFPRQSLAGAQGHYTFSYQ
jgi:tetratricopeptide (TPR) repeat protein